MQLWPKGRENSNRPDGEADAWRGQEDLVIPPGGSQAEASCAPLVLGLVFKISAAWGSRALV